MPGVYILHLRLLILLSLSYKVAEYAEEFITLFSIVQYSRVSQTVCREKDLSVPQNFFVLTESHRVLVYI